MIINIMFAQPAAAFAVVLYDYFAVAIRESIMDFIPLHFGVRK